MCVCVCAAALCPLTKSNLTGMAIAGIGIASGIGILSRIISGVLYECDNATWSAREGKVS